MSETSSQFAIFKDCLARLIIAQPGALDSSDESSELDDFSSYLALEVWPSLPPVIREASYDSRDKLPELETLSLGNCSTNFIDSFISYGLAPDLEDTLKLLKKILERYLGEVCRPPPIWSSTRTDECEICERQVPLSYHHLIPRSTHVKVLKRKWHPESMLNSVAWLCRPCHSAVHHVATNEELARNYYTLDLILGREDIQKWRKYAAKQRYGVRRG